MEMKGVISKVPETSGWCSGMVVVVSKANHKVRICVDLTKLNQYVKRKRHILPSVDNVLAQIGDAKNISKLDANSEYCQIKLSPKSSTLTMFTTPFLRYRCNQLPFEITSAQECFQNKMSEILNGTEDVVGLIDDILTFGRTKE